MSKPPVFMQHGIFDSANCWLMNHSDVAPAFVAARAGYDVWLGNTRGNTFSNSHTTFTQKDYQYWEFDWEQMGKYDIPASLDYITKLTGHQKVAYIGHS